MDIYSLAEKIKSKEDFEIFLDNLIDHFNLNKNNPDEWENTDLKDFLYALFRIINTDFEKEITWNKLADLFLTAKIYE